MQSNISRTESRTLWQRKIEASGTGCDGNSGASVLRNDLDPAGSIMFLLGIGELLEEWTHKKSVDDLAQKHVFKYQSSMDCDRMERRSALCTSDRIRPGDRGQ